MYERKGTSNRLLYVDYLRILAMLAVVTVHVAAQNFYKVDIATTEWKVFNMIDSAARWAVPIFLMISGALFLNPDKEIDIKKLYKYNILKILVALSFWSAVYAGKRLIDGADIQTVIAYFIKGNYHLWYLYMIIGIYMVLPILRKITESERMMQYFLVLGLVFTFFVPRAINIVQCIAFPATITVLEAIKSAITNMNFHLTAGYTFYFVLGYYLSKHELVRHRWFRRFGGGVLYFAGFLLTAGLTFWYSDKLGEASVNFYANLSINVLMMSVGIFIFAKNILSKIKLSKKAENIVLLLSKYSFGVYVVHVLIMDLIKEQFAIDTLSYNPVCSVLLLIFLVTTISLLISAVLNHIPVVRKYIV